MPWLFLTGLSDALANRHVDGDRESGACCSVEPTSRGAGCDTWRKGRELRPERTGTPVEEVGELSVVLCLADSGGGRKARRDEEAGVGAGERSAA